MTKFSKNNIIIVTRSKGDRMIEKIILNYEKVFGKFNGNVYFAPGRVNLIGEHTDYNGGHVFPCAIHLGTYLAIEKRNDKKLCFYSENFASLGILEYDLDNLAYDETGTWTNYPKGVIKMMQDDNLEIPFGFNLYYFGNIPNGAGLSSSASIEIVTAVMLNDQLNLNLSQLDLVKYAKRAENEFVGVSCGIMDQFAILFGKENQAILLDTNNLHYEYSPFIIEGYKLIVTNTNKKRKLTDSKYNERRSECEKALEILKSHTNIKSLGDLTIQEFVELKFYLKDEVIRRRAKHAVYENERTKKAKQALEAGNLNLFGQLMNESHISLRDDYEVTGKELDTLVELAWKQNGVIGSRMTGAGFGGCTISIVKEECINDFKKNVEVEYEKIIGYKPTFYDIEVGHGAKKLR